jgi:hypothetical protein
MGQVRYIDVLAKNASVFDEDAAAAGDVTMPAYVHLVANVELRLEGLPGVLAYGQEGRVLEDRGPIPDRYKGRSLDSPGVVDVE